MATRTIVTCDLCTKEIKPTERVIYLSAIRWTEEGPSTWEIAAKFEMSEFCSEGCAINAVRGLLNG